MGTTETARVDQLSEVISQQELLAHWQGHRDLTRRIIAAFPENDFFNFRIGGMRPLFGNDRRITRYCRTWNEGSRHRKAG